MITVLLRAIKKKNLPKNDKIVVLGPILANFVTILGK